MRIEAKGRDKVFYNLVYPLQIKEAEMFNKKVSYTKIVYLNLSKSEHEKYFKHITNSKKDKLPNKSMAS